MLVFALIIAAMAAIGVGIVLTRETLQVRWRAWIVEHLVARWLGRQRFYHLNVTGKEPPNPEYRISDDTRWATEPLVDLGIGLLLGRGGRRGLHLHPVERRRLAPRSTWAPPAASPSPPTWCSWRSPTAPSPPGLMLWVGAPLVGYVGRKNEAEGYFRFAMMRMRDNAESVALMNGAPLRAGGARPLLRHGDRALDGDRVAARPPDLDHQLRRADEADRAAAVRGAQVPLRRADAGPGDAARRRLHRGADRHLLGGRQLQPRRRVVRHRRAG